MTTSESAPGLSSGAPASTSPKRTAVTSTKPLPLTWTVVPPVTGPDAGPSTATPSVPRKLDSSDLERAGRAAPLPQAHREVGCRGMRLDQPVQQPERSPVETAVVDRPVDAVCRGDGERPVGLVALHRCRAGVRQGQVDRPHLVWTLVTDRVALGALPQAVAVAVLQRAVPAERWRAAGRGRPERHPGDPGRPGSSSWWPTACSGSARRFRCRMSLCSWSRSSVDVPVGVVDDVPVGDRTASSSAERPSGPQATVSATMPTMLTMRAVAAVTTGRRAISFPPLALRRARISSPSVFWSNRSVKDRAG